jgi:hypothetical protein
MSGDHLLVAIQMRGLVRFALVTPLREKRKSAVRADDAKILVGRDFGR